ncbi:MAG: hypothetical protein IKG18_16625 [Atopobiaceae bacterium]|nr:hypothetical protein [Atopobiaceae bacterium]
MNVAEAKVVFNDLMNADNPRRAFAEYMLQHAGEMIDLEGLTDEYPSLPLLNQLVDDSARKLMAENPEASAYYESLWVFLLSDVLFTNDERPLVLLLMVGSGLHPYRRYELVRMDDTSFKKTIGQLESQIGELRRLSGRGFVQKTEESSAVLSVVNSRESFKEQAVLLSVYLSMVRNTTSG